MTMPAKVAFPNVKCTLDFSDFVKDCRDALIVTNPIPFLYPPELSGRSASIEGWAKENKRIKKLNSNPLESLIHNANLYAIYKKENGSTEWDPVYVGHSQSKGMRSRLTAHIIKKDKRTGAMVEKAVEAVRNGAEIAVSFTLVEPEELRLLAENRILHKDKSENDLTLEWNRNGRAD